MTSHTLFGNVRMSVRANVGQLRQAGVEVFGASTQGEDDHRQCQVLLGIQCKHTGKRSSMGVESLHSDQAERMHWLAQCQANAVLPTPFAIITVVVSHNSVMKAATDELPSGVICISKPPNQRTITCGEESRNGKMEEETKCANTVVMHDRNPSQSCTRHMRKALVRRE